jgi:hypothetical protein
MTGWKRTLAWAGAMMALAASPAQAMALWRGAQLRMTHAQVSRLFPGARRPDAITRLAGPDVGDLVTPMDLAGHPARATFYFVKDALWDIVVTVDGDASLATAKAVAGQVDQDLGLRRHCESGGDGARRYDCVWPTAGNRLVRLSYAESPAGPPLLSIVFRPADRQAAVADAAAETNAARTEIQDDAFSRTVTFLGPQHIQNPFGGSYMAWRLRSWMDRSSRAVSHQLYFEIDYDDNGLRRYGSAADNSADPLPVTRIARSSTRCRQCRIVEVIGVGLPSAKLASGLSRPYQIKLTSGSGDWVIVPLDPAMIRGQFLAIAAHGGPPVPGDDQDVSPLALNFGATLGTASATAGSAGGAKVEAVADDGVFAAAGGRRGDVLTAIDGAAIGDAQAALPAIAGVPPGRRVRLAILRSGRPIALEAQF